MIKIDGVSLPAPDSYKVSTMDISQATRNAKGDMIIDRLATKMKIELGWTYLSSTQVSDILNSVSPVFFEVEFTNPKTDSLETITCYVGDRSVEGAYLKDGSIYYKNLKFNLIQK